MRRIARSGEVVYRPASLQRAYLRRHLTTATQQFTAKKLESILIANRGEIALRVSRTASQHGIAVSTLYTKPDQQSQHAYASQFALNLGDSTAGYLDGKRIIEIAMREGCDAIHPGYGFLSENAGFARMCTEAGLVFIGPPWKAIEDMGDKSRSKNIMTAAGIPCIPGYHGTKQDISFLASQASQVGYPILIKAVKGGGGKGMRVAFSEAEFESQLASAKSEARSAFGPENDAVLIEKYIKKPRHVEVQIFADLHGNIVALGERDCSVQRRHQKILEESPAPNLSPELRRDLWAKARAAAQAVNYCGAGTVEFILNNETGEFFFMEMNTRLQVEHPVTEMITGTDLVDWQIKVARGEPLPLSQEEIERRILSEAAGHAIEARIYAEIPAKGFIPDSGTLIHYRPPDTGIPGVRIDAGFADGDTVSAHYDPMIAKLITHGATRSEALKKMLRALESYEIAGIGVNIEFLKNVVRHPSFMKGDVETGFIERYQRKLLAENELPDEVAMQVAMAYCLNAHTGDTGADASEVWTSNEDMGFVPSSTYHSRSVSFFTGDLNEDGRQSGKMLNAEIRKQSNNEYTVVLDGGRRTFERVTPVMHGRTGSMSKTLSLRTFTERARLDTTVIIPESVSDQTPITAFHQGCRYTLHDMQPPWLQKLLSQRSAQVPHSSVRAPMPCKILRVEVEPGQIIEEGKPLVVVESMKMETVIRAPGPGSKIVKRVVHKVGDMLEHCAAAPVLENATDQRPLTLEEIETVTAPFYARSTANSFSQASHYKDLRIAKRRWFCCFRA
ncbi:hypothetical protein KEM54_000733 [Ascosphaera aggregata]|nr:hypothetical protein KEM54_000733 [Ascosphaera aggregata]